MCGFHTSRRITNRTLTRDARRKKTNEKTPDVMAKTKKNGGNDARFSGDATSSSNNRKMPEVGENALWKIYIRRKKKKERRMIYMFSFVLILFSCLVHVCPLFMIIIAFFDSDLYEQKLMTFFTQLTMALTFYSLHTNNNRRRAKPFLFNVFRFQDLIRLSRRMPSTQFSV